MTKDQDEVFYANIESSVEVHRSILESSKNVLSSLKKYEAFKQIRKYKIEYLMQLKHVMGEINLLANRLRRELPKTGLRAAVKKKAPELILKKYQKSRPRPETDIDKIEEDLDDIEAKLSVLE